MESKKKTYFDLTSTDRDTYRMEFRQTPYGKEVFKLRKLLLVVFFLSAIAFIVLDIYSEETGKYTDVVDSFDNYVTLLFVISIGISLWFDINFTASLKNKHNIKRW